MNLRLLFYILIILFPSLLLSNSDLSRLDSLELQLEEIDPQDTSLQYLHLLLEIGNEWFLYEENSTKAIPYFEKAKTIAIAQKYDKIWEILTDLGDACYSISEYPCCLDNFLRALEDEHQVLTSEDSVYIIRQIGYVHFHLGNLDKAYDWFLSSFKLSELNEDQDGIANFYYTAAMIDNEQKKYESALKNLNKSLQIFTELGWERDIADCFAVIGDTYHYMDSLEQAIVYKKRALEIDESFNSLYGIAYVSYSLAETYVKMDNLPKALELNEKALKLREEINDKEEVILSQIALANVHLLMKNFDKSLECLKMAKESSLQLQIRPTLRDAYRLLYKVYAAQRDYPTAFQYQEKYYLLKDSLLSEKTILNISNLSSTYEIEQQNQTIDLLQKEQKISNLQIEKNKNQLRFSILIFILISLALLIGIGYHLYFQQLRYNQKLKSQTIEIENQNFQLSGANEKLEHANSELERFAYVVSHDLKAPLRGIATLGNFIEEDLGPNANEEIKENMSLLIGRIHRMENLIKGILEYSKIEKKEAPLEWVSLNTLLKEIIDSILPINNNGVDINYPNDLPEILVAKILLQQVLQNLLNNAIKYNDKPICIIDIKFQETPSFYQFEIKDNGPGIPKRFHEKVFEIFQTLQSRDDIESTGVGLSIVKKIVEGKAKGKIWVESIEGEGAKFSFIWSK